jgi:peptide/nickel transport system substrate-binding protein
VALSKTRWPLFGALIIGGLVITMFWWLTLDNPPGEAVPASGGSYVEGVVGAPARINPLFASNQTDADLSSLVFSGLVRLGPDGTPQPDLASRWEITGNGQRYVFFLRSGVAWHDGEPFDAEDVVFTYRAISDPGFNGDPGLAQLMQGVVVEVRDPLTVEFQLEQAYAPFLAHLTVGILPRHILASLPTPALHNATFNLTPIGTGPYRFESRGDESLTLAANSTFYLGPPHISTIQFRWFDSEPSLTQALRDGEVDGALLALDASASEIELATSNQRWAAHTLPAAPYFMLYLDTRSPLFTDRDVRKAVFQSIDRAVLVDQVAGGRGTVVNTGIPPESWAFTESEVPAFSPGAAATTLEVEGFFRGRDGVRSTIENERMAFDIITMDRSDHIAVADDIARQLRATGIAATTSPMPQEEFLDALNGRTYTSALVLVDPGPDPDQYPFWHGSQILPPGLNLANYSDPRIDETVERARQTTDIERRRDLYALFNGYFISAMPSIPLFAPSRVYVQPAGLGGFESRLLFTEAGRFFDVQNWYVQTRTR